MPRNKSEKVDPILGALSQELLEYLRLEALTNNVSARNRVYTASRSLRNAYTSLGYVGRKNIRQMLQRQEGLAVTGDGLSRADCS